MGWSKWVRLTQAGKDPSGLEEAVPTRPSRPKGAERLKLMTHEIFMDNRAVPGAHPPPRPARRHSAALPTGWLNLPRAPGGSTDSDQEPPTPIKSPKLAAAGRAVAGTPRKLTLGTLVHAGAAGEPLPSRSPRPELAACGSAASSPACSPRASPRGRRLSQSPRTGEARPGRFLSSVWLGVGS